MRSVLVGLLIACFVSPSPGSSDSQAAKSGAQRDVVGEETLTSAPAFTLPDLDGKQMKSAELKGQVVVLDFWATWCGPCLAELPTFNRIHEKYAGRGVKVVGIAVQSGWSEDVKPYLEKYGIKYPILIGDDDIVEKYGVFGFPTTYILNKEFKVHRKFTGELLDRNRLEREIESLLADSNNTKERGKND
jgi:thiol-disulfide isomerase/thioredoxin